MQNPQMPHMPGAGTMSDPLEFVKNLWGNMGVPGIAAPTLSIDDLDKKIKDLKTVEIWLNVNMSMIRGSIQALEVQRATLAALKSMGDAMASQGNPFAAFAQGAAAGPAAASQPAAEATAPPADDKEPGKESANPAMWWTMMQEQFQQALAQAVSANAAHAPTAPDEAQDANKPAKGGPAAKKPHARRSAE